VFVCEVEEGCKLPIKLHPELSIFRHQPDLFDELTDAFSGLEAGVLVRFSQIAKNRTRVVNLVGERDAKDVFVSLPQVSKIAAFAFFPVLF